MASESDKFAEVNKFMSENQQLMDDFVIEFGNMMKDFLYPGFNHEVILKKLLTCNNGNPDELIIKDMQLLLEFFHMKGPNVSRIFLNNRNDKLAGVIRKYKVKSKVNGVQDAITLPRISLVFPGLSFRAAVAVKEKNLLNEPISANAIGMDGINILSCNFVPCLLDDLSNAEQAAIFFIHTIYQSHLNIKIDKNRNSSDIFEIFNNATKYATLSFEGSKAKEFEKNIFKEYYKNMKLDFANIADVVGAKYFGNKKGKIADDEITQFHNKFAASHGMD